MKRLNQLLLAVAVAVLVPFVAVTPTHAASTCDIGFTGPNSQNMCTSVQTYDCTVTNTNTVTIANTNSQQGASGQVNVSGNTSGGNGVSGSVSNSSGTTYAVTIINADPAIPTSGTCTAAIVVPANETPETVVPTQPAAPTPRALPVTSGDSTLTAVALIAGSVVGAAALSIAALALYRRAHS
jgi:hypothetical protein